jgi:hypothetical protein
MNNNAMKTTSGDGMIATGRTGNLGGWHDQQWNENIQLIRMEKDQEEELILLPKSVIFITLYQCGMHNNSVIIM